MTGDPRHSRNDRAAYSGGPEACYEVPARDERGRPLTLRLWPESGRIALDGIPVDGPVYVDVSHACELRSVVSASTYRAALLASEPDPDEDGVVDAEA
jgi:hypothetical protein